MTETLGPFALGPHGPTRGIYPGDARDLLLQLPLPCPRLILVADPPYGISLSNHALGTVRGNTRRKSDYTITGDHNRDIGLHIIDWAAQHELPLIVFASPWHPWPGKWRNLIVWDKGPGVGAGGDIRTCLKRTWELVQIARNRTRNGKRIGSVWSFHVSSHNYRYHPTQKPVPLLVRLIKTFTRPDDVILDPCIGSGSTAIAAMQAHRSYLGFEIDPHLVTVARDRIAHGAGTW